MAVILYISYSLSHALPRSLRSESYSSTIIETSITLLVMPATQNCYSYSSDAFVHFGMHIGVCLITMYFVFRIEDTHRSWKKFLHNFSSFSDWLVKCETTAKYHDFKDVTYEEARTQLKHFEVKRKAIGLCFLSAETVQAQLLERRARD